MSEAAKKKGQPASITSASTRERVVFRVDPDQKQRIAYWASRRDMTVQEYVDEAVVQKIARENGDYDLPTLEIARQNQMVDELKSLSQNVANMERSLVSGLDSLLGLARGDNSYLEDDEDDLLVKTEGTTAGDGS